MNLFNNPRTLWFFCGLLALLAACGLAGWLLHGLVTGEKGKALVGMFNARVRGWWAMTLVLFVAMLTGGIGSIVVFGLTSFLLLREFITMTPTSKGDHHALFLVFLVIPLQYYLLAIGWYGLFAILIPVYAFLLIPARMAVTGDSQRFLERAAKIQWGLMLCVYSVSHAPALLKLGFPGDIGAGIRLLLFVVLVTQSSDVTHRIFDISLGRRRIAPAISESLTLEGMAAGVAVGIALGTSLWWATPFSPCQAAGMSLLSVAFGYLGELCFHAIKKDRGKKGVVVVETRPSMIERVISLCFVAPIFFHTTRFFFVEGQIGLF